MEQHQIANAAVKVDSMATTVRTLPNHRLVSKIKRSLPTNAKHVTQDSLETQEMIQKEMTPSVETLPVLGSKEALEKSMNSSVMMEPSAMVLILDGVVAKEKKEDLYVLQTSLGCVGTVIAVRPRVIMDVRLQKLTVIKTEAVYEDALTLLQHLEEQPLHLIITETPEDLNNREIIRETQGLQAQILT